MKMKKVFNFGKNWKHYSKNALNQNKLNATIRSIDKLTDNKIQNSRFLDIGCGSGIFSVAASKAGAKEVVGFDISQESIEASRYNKKRFYPQGNMTFHKKSILNTDINNFGKFDIVYSWGVLHHTGHMWKAINNSLKLVKANGLFIIAIYNRHWSCPLWKIIKKLYNISPKIIQKIMIGFFYWIIAITKFIVTCKNPFTKRRGMNFYHDVIDWVGGYPYEYASKRQIKKYVQNKGFRLIKFFKSPVPTGCNEYVFINRSHK